MKNGAADFWRWPLPIFIRVVGYLLALSCILLLFAVFMPLVKATSGLIFSEPNPTKLAPYLVIEIISMISYVLFLFSGARMIQETNERALAEYSALQALLAARLVDVAMFRLFGHGLYSLSIWAFVFATYLAVRFNLYPFLKRILLNRDLPEAGPSASSGQAPTAATF